MEHLPLDAGEREDGDVNHRDDDHAEEHRRTHLLAGGEHGLRPFLDRERATKLVLPHAELAHDIFHDDDRAINDEAEINRAETHQIAGDAELPHAGERKEERERDGGGDDEGRAPVAEQQEENHDHQHRAFEEVFLHGPDGPADEL